MNDLSFHDEFGPITLPDDGHAKPSLYAEVCLQDTYSFRKLYADAFQVQTAIDLGASYGVASRMMRHFWPNARIIAFEPDPGRYGYLLRNCPSVECRAEAIGGFAHDRVRLLAGIGADFGPWRASPELALQPPLDKPRRVAEAFTHLTQIDLLKIDVEGFELGILQEMAEMGLLAHTRRIVGEWHFENARVGLQRCLAPTHECEIVNPGGNPWNLFRARLKEDVSVFSK